jgi:inorganic pyrophosphatase
MPRKAATRRVRPKPLDRLEPFEDHCVIVVIETPKGSPNDGDPLDVLVLMDAPVLPGCIVPSRPVGVIEAEQTEGGKTERNDRLLAVAAHSAAHRSIHELEDLGSDLVAQIEHFFVSYNEMKGKRFEVKRRAGSTGRAHSSSPR